MLKQRVITACIMALVVVAALLWLPPRWLIGLFGVATLGALWEWSDLAGMRNLALRVLYCVLAAGAMIGLLAAARLLAEVPRLWLVSQVLGIAGLWWLLALYWVRAFPAGTARWSPPPVRAAMGWLTLLPAWFAFAWLRLQDGGEWLILFLLVLVSAADIGAYFSGRALGRRKLAPDVSPGKSWEGFWGGLVSALLVALLIWLLRPVHGLSLAALLAVAAATVLASVLGDLLESMIKRQRGVKDSSALLPGHGGLMDRLDSVSAAAPVFALGLLLAQW